MGTHKIVFTPSGKRGEFASGTTVLDAARALAVDLESACGGVGTCGRCQVIPSMGDFPKFNIKASVDNINTWTDTETAYTARNGDLENNRRLGCCTTICGDMVIDVPADSQYHQQVIRKAAVAMDMHIDAVVRAYTVKSDDKTVAGILNAWAQRYSIDSVQAATDHLSVPKNPTRIFTVVVRKCRDNKLHIVDIWAGNKHPLYGFAVDLGSTTVSCHLVDLYTGKIIESVGVMNPQIRFGEDLMSRVSYAMMHAGGDKEMTAAIWQAISRMFTQAGKQAGIAAKYIVETVVVGNPVMHHLFLDYSPVSLGFSPFELATQTAEERLAHQLQLQGVHPYSMVYVPPCVAGHVGADAAAVALACRPYDSPTRHLIVDVGTNAEILYGNNDKIFACSSPTGPALEGAQITCGQRAAVGAIERVRIDTTTFEPKFRVIGCDLWSDEQGFFETIKHTSVTGICGSGIIEVLGEMYMCGILSADGIIDGDMATVCPRIVPSGKVYDYIVQYAGENQREIRVTQGDVRAIQLAKGALWAGCKLLQDHYGKPVEKITLAGAFGSHIDLKYAMILGLIPDCHLDAVTSAGNAAGTGATMVLLSSAKRTEIERIVQEIDKVETALEPAFQQYFVDAMLIPNQQDPYTQLQKTVTLPPKKIKNASLDTTTAQGRRRNSGRHRRRHRQ